MSAMPLSLQVEQFVVARRNTTVSQLVRRFELSDVECRDELERLRSFGVEVSADGRIRVPEAALAN
jgi:hypothetical protein